MANLIFDHERRSAARSTAMMKLQYTYPISLPCAGYDPCTSIGWDAAERGSVVLDIVGSFCWTGKVSLHSELHADLLRGPGVHTYRDPKGSGCFIYVREVCGAIVLL